MSEEELARVRRDTPHFFWELFKSTFLISAFTVGGGFVIIPLLRAKYVDEYGWLDDKETLNLVSIAQSMPGVVACNSAIMLGYHWLSLSEFVDIFTISQMTPAPSASMPPPSQA